MKNIMVFDPALSGHHPEYIRHLVNYLIDKKSACNYYFVLNPAFSEKFVEVSDQLKDNETVKIICISQKEYDGIFAAGSLFKRSVNEFKIMNKYASQFNIDECIILYLNGLQLAVGLYKTKYLIHGILFGQYTWQVFPHNFKGWLYKKRKVLQTWLLLSNKKVKSVFLLNDGKSCTQLNEIYSTNVFKFLPDPIPPIQPDPLFDLRKEYGIPQALKIYVQTGTLEPRKGTLEIIDAIDYLSEEVCKNIAIVITGRVSATFNDQIVKRISALVNKYNLTIIYKNNFIPDGVLKGIFEQADIILIPYKNTEASSGILGHAINNNKIVIGPCGGLLGYLISTHKAGYLLNDINGQSIANAITETYYAGEANFRDVNLTNNYKQVNTAYEFAKTIINQV